MANKINKDTVARGWYRCCGIFYVGFARVTMPQCPSCKKRAKAKALRSEVNAAATNEKK